MMERLHILSSDKSKELVITPFKWCNGVNITINHKTYSEIEITKKDDVIAIIKEFQKVLDEWQ
jgi:hypothetical protein